MFAINHAATSLLIKRGFPRAPIVPILLSVQLMELLWVVFNLVGIERTTTEPQVRSVADIHLAYMPYSHSIVSAILLTLVAWIVARYFRSADLALHALQTDSRRAQLAIAVAIGVLSHLILDLITHSRDIAIAPGLDGTKFGLGLYSEFPMVAFVLELAYGIFCWWVYKGGRLLLAGIIIFNVFNLSLLSPAVPGPESLLANRPTAIVLVTFAQIVMTLVFVGYFSSRPEPSYVHSRN